MVGAPKRYNTRQDIENGLKNYPEETKRYLQTLLDDRYCIVSSEELPEGVEPRDEPPLYRVREMTESDDEGNVTARHVWQEEWKEDSNAALFRLVSTVEEAEALISAE